MNPLGLHPANNTWIDRLDSQRRIDPSQWQYAPGIPGIGHNHPPGQRVYVIGSLSNQRIVEVANALEEKGHEVFADWFSPGPEADVKWREYEMARGRGYAQAVVGPHARNVFEFDKRWLDWATDVVLVLPAGKSGHLELGYSIGSGKRGYVLFDGEPERWDVMYGFADKCFFSVADMLNGL